MKNGPQITKGGIEMPRPLRRDINTDRLHDLDARLRKIEHWKAQSTQAKGKDSGERKPDLPDIGDLPRWYKPLLFVAAMALMVWAMITYL